MTGNAGRGRDEHQRVTGWIQPRAAAERPFNYVVRNLTAEPLGALFNNNSYVVFKHCIPMCRPNLR